MIIASGRIVADGAPENLEKLSPYHNAVLIDSESKNIVKDLQDLEIVSSNKDSVFASPGVRRLSRELDIDISIIKHKLI